MTPLWTIEPATGQLPVGLALRFIAILLVGWYGLVLLQLFLRRTRPLVPAAPGPDLGPEPPAVVNLLVNLGQLSAGAADATLLDLAARRVLELHQPGDDPAGLLVRVRQPDPTGLTSFERRVFDRVATLAGDGWYPVDRMAAGYSEAGPNWFAQLRAEVVADAVARALVTDRRLGRWVIGLSLLTGMAIACLGILPFQRTDDSGLADAVGIGSVLGWFVAGPVIALALIFAAALHVRGARLTPAGRVAGQRWLGLAGWLTAHPALADLPPAAVAIWDRYLAYGVALGASPVAGGSLDLRTGRTVWFTSAYAGDIAASPGKSTSAGAVHTVRVRYPRNPFSYTQAGVRLSWSLGVIATWALAGWLFRDRLLGAPLAVRVPLIVVGAVVLLRAGYKVIRSIVAKLAPVAVTGQVLTVHTWRPPLNRPATWFQVALDDGRHRSTRPWLVRADRVDGIRPGDGVTLRAQRWTRYVLTLRVDHRAAGPIRPAAD